MKTDVLHNSIRKEIDRLALLVPVVKRVHGKEHPELHLVEHIVNDICKQVKKDDMCIDELKDNMYKLALITDQFQPPKDACQAFQEIYKHLSFIVQRIYTIQKKEELNE